VDPNTPALLSMAAAASAAPVRATAPLPHMLMGGPSDNMQPVMTPLHAMEVPAASMGMMPMGGQAYAHAMWPAGMPGDASLAMMQHAPGQAVDPKLQVALPLPRFCFSAFMSTAFTKMRFY
jgi:hypothetical protein